MSAIASSGTATKPFSVMVNIGRGPILTVLTAGLVSDKRLNLDPEEFSADVIVTGKVPTEQPDKPMILVVQFESLDRTKRKIQSSGFTEVSVFTCGDAIKEIKRLAGLHEKRQLLED